MCGRVRKNTVDFVDRELGMMVQSPLERFVNDLLAREPCFRDYQCDPRLHLLVDIELSRKPFTAQPFAVIRHELSHPDAIPRSGRLRA